MLVQGKIMKFRLILPALGLCVLLFSKLSLAANSPIPFAGAWTGLGTYQRGTEIFACDRVEMVFTATEATFNFISGGRTCGTLKEDFQVVNLTVADNKLYLGSQEVGSLEGNTLRTHFSFSDSGGKLQTYNLSMTHAGQTLHYYEELLKEQVAEPVISFTAILKKVGLRD
jgi:hypothetical protein